MRRNAYWLLALALVSLPVAAPAQQGAAPAAPATGPIERLLQRRTDLALTQPQVQKLEAIRQQSAERERDLVAKITAARGVAPGVPLRTQVGTPAERQALREHMQASRPRMDELRQLHARQIQEARGVLTPEQNARAWTGGGQCCGAATGLMRHGAGPRGMRHSGAGRGLMRAGGRGPRW